MRECKEDYGLETEPVDFKFLVNYKHDNVTNDTVFVSRVPEDVTVSLNGRTGFRWLNIAEIEKLELGFENVKIISKLKKIFKSFLDQVYL